MLNHKDLRSLLHNSPFIPFRLHLVDGKAVLITHPDLFMPAEQLLVVNTQVADDPFQGLHFFPYESIARVEMVVPQKKAP